MIKNKLGILVMTGLMIFGIGTLTASAFCKSISFQLYTRVDGSTTLKLSNASTNCVGVANTYKADGTVATQKDSYRISLSSTGWFGKTYIGNSMIADAYPYTISYGTVAADTYVADVENENSNATLQGRYIKGTGTITQ